VVLQCGQQCNIVEIQTTILYYRDVGCLMFVGLDDACFQKFEIIDSDSEGACA
jgi:hypothetical protein